MADHPFEEHIPRLRRYALALLRDRVRADDLVQDTLERALKKLGLFRRGSDLRAWLFTVMHNVYVNQVRAASGRAATVEYQDTEPGTAAADDGAALRDLLGALERLAPEQREVLLLVGLERLSYEDTARVLDVPVGTVMSRLSRGRERLRALMAGEHASPPHLRRIK
jgi:RNA polymerase sigma-70 factor (ECF subfamily)